MSNIILCADDSKTMQTVAEITFRVSDFVYVGATSADEALQKAREQKPAIILADAIMPGKTGYDLCKMVKAEPGLADVPVVMLCGNAAAYDAAKGAEVGADGHVSKPWDTQVMLDKMTEILEKHGGVVAKPATASAAPAVTPKPPILPTTPAAAGTSKQAEPQRTNTIMGLPTVMPPKPVRPVAAVKPAPAVKPAAAVKPAPAVKPVAEPPVVRPQTARPGSEVKPPAVPSPPGFKSPAAAPVKPAVPPVGKPAVTPTRPGVAAASKYATPGKKAVITQPGVPEPPRPATPRPADVAAAAPLGPAPTPPRQPSVAPLGTTPPARPVTAAPAASEATTLIRRAPMISGTPARVPAFRPPHALQRLDEKLAQATRAAVDSAASQTGLAVDGPEMTALLALSKDVVERVVWEVVPDLAESIIRENLDRLARR